MGRASVKVTALERSLTPVVCKHPPLQDHTSPLQLLQVASGDFLAAAAACTHQSRSSQQGASSSQQFQEPMPSSNKRTPCICAGHVGATTAAALPCCCSCDVQTHEEDGSNTNVRRCAVLRCHVVMRPPRGAAWSATPRHVTTFSSSWRSRSTRTEQEANARRFSHIRMASSRPVRKRPVGWKKVL